MFDDEFMNDMLLISITVTLYHFIYRIIIGETISRIDSPKDIDYYLS